MVTKAREVVKSKKYFQYQLDYNEVSDKLELTDYESNRVIYSTDNNILLEVIEYCYKVYGKANVKVNATQGEIRVNTIISKQFLRAIMEVQEKENKVSPRIKFIKDIYKYIDKYKVGLKPKFSNISPNFVVQLFGEGSIEGENEIMYEEKSGHFLYYYRGKLMEKTKVLEEIFQ